MSKLSTPVTVTRPAALPSACRPDVAARAAPASAVKMPAPRIVRRSGSRGISIIFAPFSPYLRLLDRGLSNAWPRAPWLLEAAVTLIRFPHDPPLCPRQDGLHLVARK